MLDELFFVIKAFSNVFLTIFSSVFLDTASFPIPIMSKALVDGRFVIVILDSENPKSLVPENP